jgi:sporulation protein YlmC with PRC-barrel domain
MDHPRPSLRYVDAKDLDDKTIKFSGLEVDSIKGEKLGKVEGFIIDISSGRPYHVVVGSGGWFRHKHFLLPIGYVALDDTNKKLLADITKDRVERFPGFDKREFEKLSEDDLKRIAESTAAACSADEVIVVETSSWDTWDDYSYPTWWEASFYRPDRADAAAANVAGATHVSGPNIPPSAASGAPRDREKETMKR